MGRGVWSFDQRTRTARLESLSTLVGRPDFAALRIRSRGRLGLSDGQLTLEGGARLEYFRELGALLDGANPDGTDEVAFRGVRALGLR